MYFRLHVKWVSFNHALTYPLVMDGGDSHQMWKEPVNMLNEQFQTADKGCTLTGALDVELRTPGYKGKHSRNVTKGCGQQILWYDISNVEGNIEINCTEIGSRDLA
jgi:hypothetical protein